jgi:hypothetical protein
MSLLFYVSNFKMSSIETTSGNVTEMARGCVPKPGSPKKGGVWVTRTESPNAKNGYAGRTRSELYDPEEFDKEGAPVPPILLAIYHSHMMSRGHETWCLDNDSSHEDVCFSCGGIGPNNCHQKFHSSKCIDIQDGRYLCSPDCPMAIFETRRAAYLLRPRLRDNGHHTEHADWCLDLNNGGDAVDGGTCMSCGGSGSRETVGRHLSCDSVSSTGGGANPNSICALCRKERLFLARRAIFMECLSNATSSVLTQTVPGATESIQ